MHGTVIQLNISPGGLPKRPIFHANVTSAGIDGDGHVHTKFHGGLLRALLLIAAETLDELIAAGYPLYPGAMGENLTTRGLDPRRMRLGQRYSAGGIEIELTSIRVPCFQLDVYGASLQREIYDKAVKACDASSPRWGLSGFYASVIEPGVIRPGDIISLRSEQTTTGNATTPRNP